ncbi:MAG TPA: hypothetical protein VMG12_43060 [Polyangiaceae bacterium]|nr:hypothetical protein [Polyangiaceae bacterium]
MAWSRCVISVLFSGSALYACADAARDGVIDPNGNGTTPVSQESAEPPAAAATDDTTTTNVENSQTGSVGASASECVRDADCAPRVDTSVLRRVELLSAACTHLGICTLPVCECRMRRLPEATDAGVGAGLVEPFDYPRYPGNRDDRCSESSYSGL